MRYVASPRFDRSVRALEANRKRRVQHSIDRLVACVETGQMPSGLGLKQLRPGLWECRAGLSDRVLFSRTGETTTFLLVGNHDEIRRILRSL